MYLLIRRSKSTHIFTRMLWTKCMPNNLKCFSNLTYNANIAIFRPHGVKQHNFEKLKAWSVFLYAITTFQHGKTLFFKSFLTCKSPCIKMLADFGWFLRRLGKSSYKLHDYPLLTASAVASKLAPALCNLPSQFELILPKMSH